MNEGAMPATASHEDVLELLPFLVNDTLDGDERARVTHHLRDCVSCREALSAEREWASLLAARPVAVPDPARALARLLARIDDEHNATAVEPCKSRVLPFVPPAAAAIARNRLPLAAAATIALTITLGALTAIQMARDVSAPVYRTLAGNHAQTAALPGSLNVVFAPALAAAEIERMLGALPVTQLDARAQPGSYQIQLEHGAATRPMLEAFAAQLRSHPGVLFAEPAPAQRVETQR